MHTVIAKYNNFLNSDTQSKFEGLFNFGVFLVPALLLSVPHGVGIALWFLAALSLLYICKYNSEYKISDIKIFHLLLLSFPFYLVISNIFMLSGYDNYLQNFISLIETFIPLFLISFALSKINVSVNVFLSGALLGFIISILYALFYQGFFLKMGRINGHTHIIMFGGLTVILATLSILRCKKYPILSIMLIVSLLFIYAYNGSRGAWAAFPVPLVMIFLQLKNKERVIGFLGLVIASIFLYSKMVGRLFQAKKETWSFIERNSYHVSSVGDRLELWKGGVVLLKNHLLFGVGSGNFTSSMNNLSQSGVVGFGINSHPHMHNDVFMLLVEHGLVGLILFLLPVLYIVHLAINCLNKKDSLIRQTIFCFFSIFFIIGISDCYLQFHISRTFFLLSLIIFYSIVGKKLLYR